MAQKTKEKQTNTINKGFIGLIIIPILFWGFLLFQVFGKGKLPIASDIIPGAYYPWINYRYMNLSTLIPIKNLLISDVVSQVVPWRLHIINNFPHIARMTWNNYSLSGYPFLGSSYLSPIFNLPNIFFLFHPPELGISLSFISQLVFLFVSAFYFFKTIKISPEVSVLGASSLMMGGIIATWFEFGSASMPIAISLFLLTLIYKFVHEGSQKSALLIPPLIFLLFNSGHYQIILFSWLFVLLYSTFLVLTRKDKSSSPVFKLFFSVFIGLLISGFTLLPTLSLYKNSVRNTDLYVKAMDYGLLPPKHLTTLINPDYYGNPATFNYSGDNSGLNSYHEGSGYVGVIMVALFLGSFTFIRQDKRILFLNTIAAFSLLFTLKLGFVRSFYELNLPILSSSAASRLMILFDVTVVTSSVISLDLLLKRPRKLLLVAVIGCLLSLSLIYVNVRNLQLDGKLNNLNSLLIIQLVKNPTSIAGVTSNQISKLRTSAFSSALSFAFLSSVLIWLKWRRIPLIFLLTFITFSDVGRYFLKYNPFVEKELFYPKTEEIHFLQENTRGELVRTQYYGTAILPLNVWEAYQLESPSGYTSIYSKSYGEFVGIVNDKRLNEHPGRYVNVLGPATKLFDFLNVKYVMVNMDDCLPWTGGNYICDVVRGEKFKKVFEKANIAIFENTSVLPRAFFVEEAITVDSNSEASNILASDDFDPSKKVVVQETILDESSFSAEGDISVVDYKSNELVLNTKSDSNQLMTISNTYDEGWQVYIDGVKSKVTRANYAFQAVPIPPGDHQVKLVYLPKYWIQGLIISLTGLSIWIFQLIIQSKHKNKGHKKDAHK